MIQLIPNGPWQNPTVQDGIHEAQIHEILEQRSGSGDPMLKIVLFLPEHKLYFVNQMYFPNGGNSLRSQQRLWHFCQAIGVEQHALVENPDCAKNKNVRVEIQTSVRGQANRGQPYADIMNFLPSEVITTQKGECELELV